MRKVILPVLSLALTALLAGSALAVFGGGAGSSGGGTATTSAGSASSSGSAGTTATTTGSASSLKAESELKCSAEATPRARVACRLALTAENEYDYLPEECRALSSDERAACRQRYNDTQPCFAQATDRERDSCAQAKLNISGSVRAVVAGCEGRGAERASCVQQIRLAVFSLVKFRMYNLEQRAEAFVKKNNLDINLATDFIADLEQLKIEFNDVATIQGKLAVLAKVRDRWHAFVQAAVAAKVQGGGP